jgi:hypothetical protein
MMLLGGNGTYKKHGARWEEVWSLKALEEDTGAQPLPLFASPLP